MYPDSQSLQECFNCVLTIYAILFWKFIIGSLALLIYFTCHSKNKKPPVKQENKRTDRKNKITFECGQLKFHRSNKRIKNAIKELNKKKVPAVQDAEIEIGQSKEQVEQYAVMEIGQNKELAKENAEMDIGQNKEQVEQDAKMETGQNKDLVEQDGNNGLDQNEKPTEEEAKSGLDQNKKLAKHIKVEVSDKSTEPAKQDADKEDEQKKLVKINADNSFYQKKIKVKRNKKKVCYHRLQPGQDQVKEEQPKIKPRTSALKNQTVDEVLAKLKQLTYRTGAFATELENTALDYAHRDDTLDLD